VNLPVEYRAVIYPFLSLFGTKCFDLMSTGNDN